MYPFKHARKHQHVVCVWIQLCISHCMQQETLVCVIADGYDSDVQSVRWGHVLRQAEQAPGLVAAMLEASKHLPAMAYDIMTWAILKRLDDTSRRKIKVQPFGVFFLPCLEASVIQSVTSMQPSMHALLSAAEEVSCFQSSASSTWGINSKPVPGKADSGGLREPSPSAVLTRCICNSCRCVLSRCISECANAESQAGDVCRRMA